MSAVTGGGYGRSHDWQRGETFCRTTFYVCRACGANFGHQYPIVPDIGEAMFLAGVPDHCPEQKEAA